MQIQEIQHFTEGSLSREKSPHHGNHRELQEFPFGWVISVLSVCLFVTGVCVPLLAFTIPVADQGLPWWYSGVIYQIYPRSFQDSNGDGIGDINGISSRLDYLSDLGVRALWLSPVYESPMLDGGYDVTDFKAVDPIFGTMEDLEKLIEGVHRKEMKIIMDFIPNHTSKKHYWFQKSRQGGATNSFRNYYIWHDGISNGNGSRQPPNNWLSAFGGPAWSWDDGRQQYYLHQFTSEQPDLNLREPAVRKQLQAILQFWLGKGVDGFRADSIDKLFEKEDFGLNEPRSCDHTARPGDGNYLQHIHTSQLDEIFNLTSEWRTLFDIHERETGKYIFFTTEVWDQSDLGHWRRHYSSGVDVPSNFALVRKLSSECNAQCLHTTIDQILESVPAFKKANWQAANHDAKRVPDRWGRQFALLGNMLTLLLPGQATTYYGEELAMEGIELSYEQTLDPLAKNAGKERYELMSRDPARSPMQWDDSQNSGFSSSPVTWLPVHPGYKHSNVKMQFDDPHSPLAAFKALVNLRKEPAIEWGWLQQSVVTPNVLSFVRWAKGWSYKKYLITMNIGSTESVDDYTSPVDSKFKIKKEAIVVVSTLHNQYNVGPYKIGDHVNIDRLKLIPGQGLVLAF